MIATSDIREAPVFHEPLINVEVITGQPLHLECQVSGIPTPELTWKHNNKPILQNSPGFEIHYDPKIQWASLNVKEAFPKVSGRYTCRARNIAGEATTTAVVCVKGIPPTEVSDTEAMNESDPKFQASKPAFYVPLKNQVRSTTYKVVFLNREIKIYCKVTNVSHQEIKILNYFLSIFYIHSKLMKGKRLFWKVSSFPLLRLKSFGIATIFL